MKPVSVAIAFSKFIILGMSALKEKSETNGVKLAEKKEVETSSDSDSDSELEMPGPSKFNKKRKAVPVASSSPEKKPKLIEVQNIAEHVDTKKVTKAMYKKPVKGRFVGNLW